MFWRKDGRREREREKTSESERETDREREGGRKEDDGEEKITKCHA